VKRNAVLWQLLPLSMLKAEGCNFRDLLCNCEFTSVAHYVSRGVTILLYLSVLSYLIANY
jgi:hypothetical protein